MYLSSHFTLHYNVTSFDTYHFQSSNTLREYIWQFLLINLSCVFRIFSLYVSIETQPLKQHINTVGTRREIRLAYFAFYGARIQETLETSGVTKSCSQPFSVIYIVDRINCCSVLF